MSDKDNRAETSGEFTQAEPASDERRSSQRFAYRTVQAVAPYDGTQLPTSAMFQRVLCHDLSSCGISFVWPRVPEFEQVIIKLAARSGVFYVVASVVSHRPLNNSKRGVLVGCKFLNRVCILE